MASVYLRKRTFWCSGTLPNGTRWQESTKVKEPNRKAAEAAAREIELKYALDPTHKARSLLTVEKALEHVRKYQETAGRAPATLQATRYHCEHLLGVIQPSKPLCDITLADTSRYLRERLAQGAHRHTISKELRTLSQAMRRCAKMGLYRPELDPTHFIPDELGKVYVPRSRWLTRDEYNRLLTALAPNPVPTRNQRITKTARRRADRQDRRDYVIAWCNLGVRKSELFDVQPGDYDPVRQELMVRGTKTEKSKRKVPVNAAATEVLARRCQLGKPFPEWSDGSCTRDLKAACKRAKIEPVSPNDLRRTFCSWLCQQGVAERVCAELMGHASTLLVRSVYGQLDMASMMDAVRRIGSVAGGVVPALPQEAP